MSCRRFRPTSSWPSTGSPRRRSRTPFATPAARTSTSASPASRARCCCASRTTAAASAPGPTSGGGIRGMRERALMIGGRLVLGVGPGGRRRGRPDACRSPPAGGRCAVMRAPSPIRILLADDHAVVRRGLRLVLESEPRPAGRRRGRRRRRGGAAGGQGRRRPGRARHLDAGDERDPGRTGARPAAAAPAHADPLDARQRAVLPRGAAGRSERLRAEVGRRSRPDPRLPRGDARGAVRVPRRPSGRCSAARSTTTRRRRRSPAASRRSWR